MLFLTITNSLGNHQILPWKPPDIDFVEFGISFSALNCYNSTDRPHVIAPVGEDVLVIDFLRPRRVTIADWSRRERRFHRMGWINAPRHLALKQLLSDVLRFHDLECSNKTPQAFAKGRAAEGFVRKCVRGQQGRSKDQRNHHDKVASRYLPPEQVSINPHRVSLYCQVRKPLRDIPSAQY